jgi:hypothetical protein
MGKGKGIKGTEVDKLGGQNSLMLLGSDLS